ncbi:MAG: trypsin-like peptidase domain-containing protein [Clostridia bacterium]|nr:trypsin-like peptidase domain-containing protein [Clostridia bacterium]
MGYIEKTAYYRRALDECVAGGDRENAKLNAIMYMRVLREMAELTDGYGAKAYLQNEADWYESVAVLIALEGVSDRVKIALRDGIGKNVRPIEASSACSPAPIVSVVLPQPEEPKGKDKNPKLLSPDKGAQAKAMAEEKIPKDDCLPTAQSSEWIADVFEKRLPATMVVSTESGCGTGFFVSSDGLFLTNHHVVHEGSKRCARINICTGDEKFCCGAKLVATDQKRDLALLQAETGSKRTPFIPLIKDYSKLRPGMDVMVIGNALSFGLAPIAGTVKFTHSKGDNDLIFTAPSNHGDSGGPVLNRQGECVGINKSVTVSVTRGGVKVNTRGLTNATPADEIAELLTNWKK